MYESAKYNKEQANQISILSLLSTYGIKVDSRNFCLCPLHKEKTASCKIYPETNTFFCFSCRQSGDVIKLVQAIESCSFLDAVKKLAEKSPFSLNNPLSPYMKANNKAATPTQEKGVISPEIMSVYSFFYELIPFLADRKNSEAYQYVTQNRGISHDTIERFLIKVIENPAEIAAKLKEKFSTDILRQSGLFTDKGFIFYQPCIIFPVFDRESSAIEPPIYFTSRNLAGTIKSFKLSEVKQRYFIGDMSQPEILIFEGVIDALSYYELTGKENFIVCYGIISGKEFSRLHGDFPDHDFILAFDNDDAGKKGEEAIKSYCINNDITQPAYFDWPMFLKNNKVPENTKIKDMNDFLTDRKMRRTL